MTQITYRGGLGGRCIRQRPGRDRDWAVKTELIKPRGPWRTVDEVDAATLHYVHWFNHARLLEVNGDLSPIELEQAYYRLHNSDLAEAG